MAVDEPTEQFASLPVINYEALANKDADEIQKLAQAGQKTGMWYVDLRGPKTKAFFDDIPAIFKTGESFFNLPSSSEEKIKVLEDGEKKGHANMDRGYHTKEDYHYYEIAINEYLTGKWYLPSTIEDQKECIDRAIQTAKGAAQLILSELCAAVGITIPELSADMTRESDTCFKLVHKPAVHNAGGVVIPWHIDFGILTFLWYDDPTTQIPIFDKNGNQTDGFETVGVKEGCVLVYVSEDLETKSGGRLRGATHRVVAPPGDKRLKNGLVYMIRPYTS